MNADAEAAARVETREGYAAGAGRVRLYYRAAGLAAGHLMILLHGFPDDHRTWDAILPPLAGRFHVVTPDLRGYCRSDKPDGVDAYRMDQLVGDVLGLIRHFGRERATLVGHDWGGVIAQATALHFPQQVERLVMLNIPHLSGLRRELAFNRRQKAASAYARLFQDGVLEGPFDFNLLLRQLRGRRRGSRMFDILRRSDVTALLNYYRANYPRPPYRYVDDTPRQNIHVPTTIVFGMRDPYILPECLDDNERWFDAPLRLIRVPQAGHWVHEDAPELVWREIAQEW